MAGVDNWEKLEFDSWQEQRFISSLQLSYHLLAHPTAGYCGSFSRSKAGGACS